MGENISKISRPSLALAFYVGLSVLCWLHRSQSSVTTYLENTCPHSQLYDGKTQFRGIQGELQQVGDWVGEQSREGKGCHSIISRFSLINLVLGIIMVAIGYQNL